MQGIDFHWFRWTRALRFNLLALLVVAPTAAGAKPYVEFDFARVVAARQITPAECDEEFSGARLVAIVLPVSVRFHGVTANDVHEIHIEIIGAEAGLRVHDFSPATQLASEVAEAIESTTTVKKDRSIDATLGGQLPVPYAKVVAHVAPSINVGAGKSEIETEKLNRLPPKHPVVVSGTSSEGRGVFFKLKRSSQTSLEGVHALRIVFVAPHNWRADAVRVACSAHGRRELLWIEQPRVLGQKAAMVELYVLGNERARVLAHKRAERARVAALAEPSLLEVVAAEMSNIVDAPSADQ